MIYDSQTDLKERIKAATGRTMRSDVKVTDDTINFFSVQPDMVVRLEGNDYFIRGHATEGRFGIDDQPKFWVKYAADLETGRRIVLKLLFYEDFTARIGPFLIKARRSPEKESRILDMIRGHPHFMQGRTVMDGKGNPVRVIEFIRGKTFYSSLNRMEMEHEAYFFDVLPGVLDKLLVAFEAMADLNKMGEQHGDIRNDHLLIEAESELYRWIDFDYSVGHTDYDLWSLGNLVIFALGKGAHTVRDTQKYPKSYPGLTRGVVFEENDMMMCHQHRVANLSKLFPYIPEKVSRLLRNFSAGSEVFYDNPDHLLNDLREATESIRK